MAGKNKHYCSDLSLSSTATNLRQALNISRILCTVNESWGGVLSQRKMEVLLSEEKRDVGQEKTTNGQTL